MSRDITAVPPVAADRWLRYGDDPNQFFDLWMPAGPARGAAVMIHGGFWRARYDLSHASHLCSALAKSGFAVANLEYRRVGNPGGGWPGTFHDIVAGFKAATQQFGRAMRTVVIGHSAGGYLALRLASEKLDLHAAVALAPVADLRLAYELNLSNGAVLEFMGGTPADIPDLYAEASPATQPPASKCVLIHGTADDVVPIQLSENFEAAVGDESKATLLRIPGANHFDLIDPESPAWPTVMGTVDRLLG
jgi:dipeptidyl aminopeptidase/acylaminoacyl peptidase